MNKTEFLNELEKRIRVLEKNEIKDILSEYSQHIDMRMESGLSEADAIKDFGNMDDLAAEILEAYHVNPEYEKNDDTVTDAVENKKGLKGLWTAFMGICASAAGGIKSFFKACGRLIKKIVLKIWSLISLLWFKIKGLFSRKEKPVQSEADQIINENDINENTDIKKSDKHRKIGKAKGRCRNDQRIFIYMPGNYSYTLSYTCYNRRTYFRIRTRGINSVDGTGLSCSGNIYNMSRLLCDGCFSLASSCIAYNKKEEYKQNRRNQRR